MSTQAASAPAGFVAVGWSTRPSGGNLFHDSLRHLRRDAEATGEVRALCGVKIPHRVVWPPRNAHDPFARIHVMTERDLAAAEPCARCHRKAGIASATTD